MPLSFDAHGMLHGDHELTIDQLRESLLVRGPTPRPTHWDETWRLKLVDNLEILVKQLWTIGLREIFIGGSFAEDRDHPNDIDGYFVCRDKWFREFVSGQLEKRLNLLDRYRVWTWDKQPWPKDDRGERQIPMWHQYRVALYPLTLPAMPCGIPGPKGAEQSFDRAFRRSRRGWKPRGMIQIVEGVQ
jgi:hypothetical protein